MSIRNEGQNQSDRKDAAISRRQALKGFGILSASWILAEMSRWSHSLGDALASGEPAHSMMVPRRPLGRTGVAVPILGLGGGHLIRKNDEEGVRIVHEAIESGLTFMDNAWDYANNRSEEVMGKALAGKRQQVFLMTKMCTHGRGKKVGLLHLEQSLRRLGTAAMTMRIGSFNREGQRMRSWRPSNRARSDSSALQATPIPPFI